MLLEVCFTVFAVLLLLLLHSLFSRRPVCQGGKNPREVKPPIHVLLQNPEAIQYDCQDLHAPKVSGRLFKFLIWLGYTPFGKLTFVSRIKRKSNLDRMGGVYIPEKPTLYPTPPIPPDTTDYSKPNERIIRRMLDKEIEQPLSDSGFRFPTVADYIRAFRSGVCTPTDIAKAVLAAIEDSNAAHPPLRAIVDSNREVVLAMAEASTERWRTGKTLSVLDGIPIAIKGVLQVGPYVFRGGCAFVPEVGKGVPEAAIYLKLKDAGAVAIGISNLQEVGLGTLGSNPNRFHLTARNPYNTSHYPGGSSSGSAASVAAGLCPIAIGTDGGGSIRIPATVCGVVGIKPTNRAIDILGIMPVAHSVSAAGPLCSSVLDTAITMDVISRETEGDKKLLSLEGLGEAGLEGMTVGVYWEFFEHADEEIVGRCKQAVNQLQSLGATIVEIKIPELEDTRIAHVVTILSEMGCALSLDVDKHFSEINLETLLGLSGGYSFSATEYINAQKQRTRAVESLKHVFETVDLIVTPGTACVGPSINPGAIPLGESDSVKSGKLMRFSFLANLTGIPGLVLPVGYTSGGLPIGLQLMGRWYEERVLLKAAWALENSGAFPLKKPQVFYDLIQTAEQEN